MKISIDGLSISKLYGTGLYSYTYGLVSNLLEIFPQPKYELISDINYNEISWKKYKNLNLINLNIDRKRNNYKALEEYLINSNIDLFHSPNNGFSIPQNKVCKYIISVHDLSPLSCREIVDIKYHNKFNSIFPHALNQADHIIVVSRFIKEELIRYFHISDKKIDIVYPWCPSYFKLIDKNYCSKILRNKYNIDNKFLLYVGSIHKRKNLHIIIQALKLLVKQIPDIKLVIIGNYHNKRKDYYLSLVDLIAKLGMEKNVIFLGTVPYKDMPYFYNCSMCTINLSTYDGFPTTSVEAISCDSPLICLRTSSFEEVLGHYPLYFDHINMNANELTEYIQYAITKKLTSIHLEQPFYNQKLEKQLDYSIRKIINIYESIIYGL